jgi:hypothetical protein
MATVQRSTFTRNLNTHHEPIDLDLDWEGQPSAAYVDPHTATYAKLCVDTQADELDSWAGTRRSQAEIRLWWERELSYQRKMLPTLQDLPLALAGANARIDQAERTLANLVEAEAIDLAYEPTEADTQEAARCFARMHAERYGVIDENPFEDESTEPAAEPIDALEELRAQRSYFRSLGTKFGDGMARWIGETISTWQLCAATTWEEFYDRSIELEVSAKGEAWSEGYDDGHADASRQCREFGPRREYRGQNGHSSQDA